MVQFQTGLQPSGHSPRFGSGISTINDDISLKNRAVQGQVKSINGNVTLKNVTLNNSVSTVNGSIELKEKTQVVGSASSVSGSVVLSDASIQGTVKTVSGNIKVKEQAQVTGLVSSDAGKVTLNQARVNGHVKTTTGDIVLSQAVVTGDVQTEAGDVTLHQAEIGGTLTLPGKRFTVDQAKLNHIVLNNPESNSVTNVVTSGSIIGGSIFIGGSVGRSSGGSVVAVGPGSISSVNGFQATADRKETRLITPDGNIYVNGDKVHGKGPDTYAEYKKTNHRAPSIQGPGWTDAGVKQAKAEGSAEAQKPQEPKGPEQIIELRPGAIVSGNITFDSGNGKVVIYPGAKFNGKVNGGVVEHQTIPGNPS